MEFAFEIEFELPAFNRHSSCSGPVLEDVGPKHANRHVTPVLSHSTAGPSSAEVNTWRAVGNPQVAESLIKRCSRQRSRWARGLPPAPCVQNLPSCLPSQSWRSTSDFLENAFDHLMWAALLREVHCRICNRTPTQAKAERRRCD